MIITGLSNSKKLARKIAEKLNLDYEDLKIEDSPEQEIHVRFKHDLKNKKVVLVQSLYPHPNYALFEVLFAASSARDLGAREIIYAAPYLAYLKEDSRKEKGECVSLKVIGDLLSRNVDSVITVEPHIHQHSEIGRFFSIPFYRLDCGELLRNYANKNFKGYKVGGVGERAKILARRVDKDAFFCGKEDRVENLNAEKILLVDDIVASGRSMLSVLNKLDADNICLMAVHGLFTGDAYGKLNEKMQKIITTNTIVHGSNELDVSDLIARKLMEI